MGYRQQALCNSNTTSSQNMTIAIQAGGTVSNGNNTIAIQLSNSNVANTQAFTITNQGLIDGAVVTSGLRGIGPPALPVIRAITLDINGASADVVGAINLGVGAGAQKSQLLISNGADYTANSTISNIGIITVQGNSTFTANQNLTSIEQVSIASGSTFNLNATMSGVTVDGDISVSGTFNLSGNVTKLPVLSPLLVVM